VAAADGTAALAHPRARHRIDTLKALTRSDLRTRYGRGNVRVLKWLLDPIFATGIYLALVSLVLDRSDEALGLSLACAVVPFQLLVSSTLNALQSVPNRGSIIINMGFPRMLIPLASVATESVAVIASFSLFPAMMIVYGVEPTLALLWLPVACAITVILSVAFAYPAAVVGVWYPELIPFAVSFLRALFFVAPGIVALNAITGTAHDLMYLNPFTGIFETFRHTFLYGDSPAPWELLAPLGFAAAILAIGLPLYRREHPQFAKLLG
jgi:ABC-type polysaccharide/polyol phosphate export permease